MSVKKYKLKNNLSILLIENHKSPVVSVQMWVRTGSADEAKGQEGISHFIEHLVFKGTEKYAVGEIASQVEASGGELNAYTSFDQTVFHVTISSHYVDTALSVISEMMGFPTFDPKEVDNEREVVIEEIKRGQDSPHRQASQLLFRTSYKKHPYGIPVIGYDKVIRKVTGKQIDQYFKSRYVPKNMQLVVVGDFSTPEMKAKVQDYFGKFKDFKLKKVVRKKEAAQKSARIEVQKSSFEESLFHISWPIPKVDHKDVPALDVLSMVLGQGDSSRLVKRLRIDSAIANSVGSSSFTPKNQGLFTVSGSANSEKLKDVFTGVHSELQKILSSLVSFEEMKKALVNLESEEFYALETVDGIARKAGSLEDLLGDYKYFEKYLKQVQSLKPEDLLKIARKYLRPESMSIVCLVKENDSINVKSLKNDFKVWHKNFAKEFKKSVVQKVQKPKKQSKLKSSLSVKGTTKSSSLTPKIETHKLKNGGVVLFRTNTSTPVLSVRAGTMGGLRIENPEYLGSSELLSRVWTSGTKNLSETDIQEKIENMAGGISAFSGRNSLGLSMQTLSPFEKDASQLFADILTKPVFSEQSIEREKIMMLESLKSKQDHPGQVVSQMFLSKMFDGHPYALDILGTQQSIAKLDKSYLNKEFKRTLANDDLAVVITGDAHKDHWIKLLEEATQTLPQKSSTNKKQNLKFTQENLQKDIREFEKLNKEQTHIIWGFRGLNMYDPRRYTLYIIQSILAGQGGRLFIELRDKESLAYTVSPMHMEGIESGYFGAYIGCSPEKSKKALEMMRTEFEKLVNIKVPQEELDRAKKYLIGRHDIDLQRNSAIGSSLFFNKIYGLNPEEIFDFASKIEAITVDDVQKLARELFTKSSVTAVVGSQSPW